MRTNQRLWSAFWVDSARDGCTASFPTVAKAAIAGRWRKAFSNMSAPVTALDIACGRGAVHAEAIGVGVLDRGVTLIGVDCAEGYELSPDGVRMIGGVDAMALPFDDRSIDLVTSQFGVEYAGLDGAISEAARVCKDRLLLLMHAADGIVCRQMREQIEQTDWLLEDQRLGARMAAPSETESTGLIIALDARARSSENVSLLAHLRECVVTLSNARGRLPADDYREMLAAVVSGVVAHRDRLHLLISAAPDRDAVARVAAGLSTAGFAVAVTDERYGDDIVGRWIDAHRVVAD